MKQKSKFEQWKEAVKNVPPERLLKINMQGYALQSLGVIAISVVLLFTDMWFLIFIFLFSLWNNVSGLISQYQQYTQLIEMRKQLNLKQPEDKSPHRKKSRIIKKRVGRKADWISAIVSVGLAWFIVPDWPFYFRTPLVVLLLGVFYYVFYFLIFYNIAKLKRGK